MLILEKIISDSKIVREVKRAVAVNMVKAGLKLREVCKILNVSDAFVSKWKIIYENKGAEGLLSGYKGSKGYLDKSQKDEIKKYLETKEYLSIEELRDYIEKEYGVLYKSKQSYNDLLNSGGLSWHKTQKKNPRRNWEKVLLKREEIKKKLKDCEAEIKSGELYVFAEDECHLLWGDTLGYVWGRRNNRIEIPILNEKERQTYYGAVDLYRKDFHVRCYDQGNSHNTVLFVKYLQRQCKGKKLLLIWDKASYHRYSEMRSYLEEVNEGLEEKDWKITCLLFESAAPEQNPVEDIWLKGKNFLRRQFYQNKTFAPGKKQLFQFFEPAVF
jgi:putative transposase